MPEKKYLFFINYSDKESIPQIDEVIYCLIPWIKFLNRVKYSQ